MRRLHRVVVILVLPLFFFTCSDEPNRSPTIQVVAIAASKVFAGDTDVMADGVDVLLDEE